MNPPQETACSCSPEKSGLDKQNLLLKGLEILEQSYLIGPDNGHLFDELKTMEADALEHAQRLGQTKEKQQALHDLIADLRLVDDIIQKYQCKKSALIQILLAIQKQLNWLPPHTLKWVAARLDIPYARIYTIANFYEAISLEPRGAHQVHVCMGTACHVRGAAELMQRISHLLNVAPGNTDSDLLFTLESVHCMGCCALGPVIKVDEKYHSDPKVTDLKKMFGALRDNREQSCQK